jgi:hypothetical protein
MHEAQRTLHTGRVARLDPTLAPWDELAEIYRKSSRQRVDQIVDWLVHAGYAVCASEATDKRPVVLAEDQVEQLAEVVHRRWVAERHLDGWEYRPRRDLRRKTSPYLVPWAELPEEIRESEREAMRMVPATLAQAGLGLVPTTGMEHRI